MVPHVAEGCLSYQLFQNFKDPYSLVLFVKLASSISWPMSWQHSELSHAPISHGGVRQLAMMSAWCAENLLWLLRMLLTWHWFTNLGLSCLGMTFLSQMNILKTRITKQSHHHHHQRITKTWDVSLAELMGCLVAGLERNIIALHVLNHLDLQSTPFWCRKKKRMMHRIQALGSWRNPL